MNSKKINKINSPETWNNHWAEFVNEQSSLPAVKWRCRLLISLIKKIQLKHSHPCIIDFGSGPGILLRQLSEIFPHAQLIGLEQSTSAIAYASSEPSRAPIQYILADLLSLTESDEKILPQGDICICTEVLEHIYDTDNFLKSCCKYIKSDGILLVTVPGGPQTEFTRNIGHITHYSPQDLKKILSAHFHNVECYGAGFPFYNIYQICCYFQGKRLVKNNSIKNNSLIRLGSIVFNIFFHLNSNQTSSGWQTIGIARNPKQKNNE